MAGEALYFFGPLDDIEREAAADTFHAWLTARRQKVPNGSGTAKAVADNL